jgi:hypothetical protein
MAQLCSSVDESRHIHVIRTERRREGKARGEMAECADLHACLSFHTSARSGPKFSTNPWSLAAARRLGEEEW